MSADGTTLAVGARLEESNATGVNGNGTDNSANVAGAVYVFTRNGSTWTQQAYIKPDEVGAFFGEFIDLSGDGNVLAVAESPGFLYNRIYLFARAESTWSQQRYLNGVDRADDFSRPSLSYDGRTLAVGARFEESNATGVNGDQTDNSLNSAGATYVYDLD